MTSLFDLEERTFKFARNVRATLKNINKTIINLEDIKQLLRSSASIGANYIEANESMSKKDFIYRIKICKKESKETSFWLRILKDSEKVELIDPLIKESSELMNIFGAILQKVSKTN